MSHNIKQITVNVVNNTATIEIEGYFMSPKYSLERIDVKQHEKGIELHIVSTFDENGPIIGVTKPFKRNMYISSIRPGRYYARVDDNNKWVKWFDVK